jgi:hypothetical protein
MLDATGCAAVLARYASALRACLEKAGLVHDQHPVGLTQMLNDIRPQSIAPRLGAPRRPPQ